MSTTKATKAELQIVEKRRKEIHDWQKGKLKRIQKYDRAEITDCLQYQKFKYSDDEWANVSDVIPRFLVYMEKYMTGISEKCNEFNEREHIDLLRSEMEITFRLHTKNADISRTVDLNEKKVSNRKISNIYSLHDNTKLDFECFRKRAVEFENSATTTKSFLEEMKLIMLNREAR